MELVPILSTIILVGTIATFILAVAAYILYKIRERRARDDQRTPETRHPEPHVLVAPQTHAAAVAAPVAAPPEAAIYTPPPTQAPAPTIAPAQPQSSFFWEYTDEGFVPVNPQEEEGFSRQHHMGGAQETGGYAWV